MFTPSTTLYLDCSCGISGDMTAAALLDLGADEALLRETLKSLPLDGYEIAITRVKKSGIDACDFDVKLDALHENHDHDMAYLHGSMPHTHAASAHHEEAAHHHEHPHEEHPHGEHAHAHTHAHGRGLPEIMEILRSGSLTPGALKIAESIFRIVAEAESKVHGKSINEVHFHEVGAVDSIVDIASIAVCIDNLGIKKVIIPSLSEGSGMVRCQHGLLPIPVPATAAIAAMYHLPLHIGKVEGELVTPTGAAAAAALMTDRQLPEQFEIEKIGIGAGKRTYENAGILRAMLIRDVTKQEAPIENAQLSTVSEDQILILETNIDDCTGEALGLVMENLMKSGALDAFYIPIYMKKNRPAYLLQVMTTPEDRSRMEDIIFRHTTTIGIRCLTAGRSKLPRLIRDVDTPWGSARVKYSLYKEDVFAYPEYDSVSSLTGKNGIGFTEMYHLVKAEAEKQKPKADAFSC